MSSRLERLWDLWSGPFRETINAAMPPVTKTVLWWTSRRLRAEHPWRPLTRSFSTIEAMNVGHLNNINVALDDERWLTPCDVVRNLLKRKRALWAMTTAARFGDMEAIEWCMSADYQLSNVNMAIWAAYGGHVRVLQWIDGRGALFADPGVMEAAAAGGQLGVLRWLRAMDPQYPWNERVCAAAARNGHLRVLQWLRAKDHVGGPCPWNDMVLANAARLGRVDILEWGISQDPPCPRSPYVFRIAASKGNIRVLQWLRDHDFPWAPGTCWIAARTGQLDVLQWLLEQGCPYRSDVLYAAATYGHVHVLRWARSQTEFPFRWTASVCEGAAGNGKLGTLQWLRGLQPPCPWSPQTCNAAASRGQLHVLAWARSCDPPCPWGPDTYHFAMEDEDKPVKQRLRVMQWLIDHGCPMDASVCYSAVLLANAAILRWLRSRTPPCPWDVDECRAVSWCQPDMLVVVNELAAAAA